MALRLRWLLSVNTTAAGLTCCSSGHHGGRASGAIGGALSPLILRVKSTPSRNGGLKAKAVKGKLDDPGTLPSVDEAKAEIALTMQRKITVLKSQQDKFNPAAGKEKRLDEEDF